MPEPLPTSLTAAPAVSPTAAPTAFIARWQGVAASELATAKSFVIELCELLGVPRPHATAEQAYMFERPVSFRHGDGSSSAGRIDCYRRGAFVLESKKLSAGTRASSGTPASGEALPGAAPGRPAAAAAAPRSFDAALLRARSQAENYARALPSVEGRPPFVVVVDVGHVIEL